VTGDVLHVDFNEISLTKAIEVNVPLVSKGEPEGAKIEGGTLEHQLWELKVECLPTQIPANIEVDVSKMKIGDNILIKDIPVPEGIKILHSLDQIAFSLKPPTEEKPVAAEALEGEAAVQEPEVLKQKSEEQLAKEAAEREKEKQEKQKE
jgi:large subunit ribosomal protein L25